MSRRISIGVYIDGKGGHWPYVQVMGGQRSTVASALTFDAAWALAAHWRAHLGLKAA